MAKKKSKFYAVAKGLKPGIYTTWAETEPLVRGYVGAMYKSFPTLKEAEEWMGDPVYKQQGSAAKSVSRSETPEIKDGVVTIFTDGSSIDNPGPGGYGVVQIFGHDRKELSGGFNPTTNNRMELMACIVALRELETKYRRSKPIILYSDSSYVVNGIMKGWALKWRSNNWIKASDKKPALNPDLWAELLDLTEDLDITFRWVKGHAGHEENERCDVLANSVARQGGLPKDTGYIPNDSEKNKP